MARFGWAALRIAYGGFFLAIGIYSFWLIATGAPNPFLAGEGPGPEFQRAMDATGVLTPLMLAMYVIGGLALIIERIAPFGIVVLAPFVAVISVYHLFLTGSVVWGLGWAIALALLAWRYRSAFAPLFNYRA